MAKHVRTQLRELVASIVTGLATTGARVFTSRVYPLEATDLPALLVFSDEETSQTITIDPPGTQSRLLTLNVKAVAAANIDLDDVLDQICKEAEVALATATLEPLARNIELTGTRIDLEGTAEHPTGSATMTYTVEYMTARNAPDVAL